MSRCLMILLFLPLMAFSPPNPYQEAFGDAYSHALDFCKKEKNNFQQIAEQYEIDPILMQAIVFPELMRYDAFRDFFETEGLELAYVKGGADLADFSIGHFQMKPSFAEFMDAKANEDEQAQWAKDFQELCSYPAGNEGDRRRERLKRLQDKDWQLRYLAAFIQYSKQDLSSQLKKKDQLRYIATRYNCGPQKNWEEVRKWLEKETFPYGPSYDKGTQFNYSRIALDYYKKQK